MFGKLFKQSQVMTVSVNEYLKKIKESYVDDEGFRYPNNLNFGTEYNYTQTIAKKYLDDTIKYLAPELPITRLRTWYLDNSFYQKIAHKDKEKALQYFAKSTAYGFLAILINYRAARCQIPYRINYYSFSTINTYMSQCLIAGYKEEYDDVSRWFYNAILHKNTTREKFVNNHETIYVDYTTDQCNSVWFLYLLYKKSSLIDIQLNIDISLLKKYYTNVLNIWDTDNLDEVEKNIYILSEYHIESISQKEKDSKCSNSLYFLFPYEILTWLKLRELKGLKNPKTFTHPLMNTPPIAKMFLNIKEPLPYPKELPYAKELLEKLKEQCPDVEIPEWLDSSSSYSTITVPYTLFTVVDLFFQSSTYNY